MRYVAYIESVRFPDERRHEVFDAPPGLELREIEATVSRQTQGMFKVICWTSRWWEWLQVLN